MCACIRSRPAAVFLFSPLPPTTHTHTNCKKKREKKAKMMIRGGGADGWSVCLLGRWSGECFEIFRTKEG